MSCIAPSCVKPEDMHFCMRISPNRVKEKKRDRSIDLLAAQAKKKLISEINQFSGTLQGKGDSASFLHAIEKDVDRIM